jgi:DNA glycosylase AlkZ-like
MLVHRHRLADSARTNDVVAIASDLVGFHSSDPTSVYLSAGARMANPAIETVQQALYTDRTLVRHHAMRRTIWVHPLDLATVAHAATTTRYAERERLRFVKMLENSSPISNGEEWIKSARATLLEALGDNPGISTRALGELLPELKVTMHLAQGKSYAGTQSALSRLMLQLGFEGLVARCEPLGSWNNSQYQWDLMDRWLPDGWQEADPHSSRVDLVRRWLVSFGPGTERDIAWWTGLPLGMVRQALDVLGAEKVNLDAGSGWIAPDHRVEFAQDAPSVALLPGLDPTTMGWKERDWYLDPDQARLLFDANGNGGPTIWLDGRIIGGWVQGADGSVHYLLTADVGSEIESLIVERSHELEKFWGDVRFKVRFPAPLQKKIL